MKKWLFFPLLAYLLSACALTPEQAAQREAKQRKAAQAMQVQLARQCDQETAELMLEQFNPPLSRTEAQQQAFEQRYTEKVNHPVFQACYKLALENHKVREELDYLRMHYDDFPMRVMPRYCYLCR